MSSFVEFWKKLVGNETIARIPDICKCRIKNTSFLELFHKYFSEMGGEKFAVSAEILLLQGFEGLCKIAKLPCSSAHIPAFFFRFLFYHLAASFLTLICFPVQCLISSASFARIQHPAKQDKTHTADCQQRYGPVQLAGLGKLGVGRCHRFFWL